MPTLGRQITMKPPCSSHYDIMHGETQNDHYNSMCQSMEVRRRMPTMEVDDDANGCPLSATSTLCLQDETLPQTALRQLTDPLAGLGDQVKAK